MSFWLRRRCLRLLFVCCTLISFGACANAQDYSGYDLSTIERVNAAREAKLGKRLDEESKGCVVIPKELPNIILLGSFAYDRGCELEGAIINKRGVLPGKDLSRVALESLGWKSADAEKRKEIALRWVQFGLLAFENPLTQATEDFTDQQFQTPQSVANADGSIAVSLWIRRLPGMRCESAYDKLLYQFTKDGALADSTADKSFSIPCKSSR